MAERVLRHLSGMSGADMQRNADTALQLLTDVMSGEHDSRFNFALSELNIATRFMEVELVLLRDIALTTSGSRMVISRDDQYSAGTRGVIEWFYDAEYFPWADSVTATVREMASQWPRYVIGTYGHGIDVQDEHPPPAALLKLKELKLKELVDPTPSKTGGAPFADPGAQTDPGAQGSGNGSGQPDPTTSGGGATTTGGTNTNPNPPTTAGSGSSQNGSTTTSSGRVRVDNRMLPNSDPVSIVGPGIILDRSSDQQHGSSQEIIDANRDRSADTGGQGHTATPSSTDGGGTGGDGIWSAAGDARDTGGGKTGGGTWYIDLDTGKKIFVPSADGQDGQDQSQDQGGQADASSQDGGTDGQGEGDAQGEALAGADPGGSPSDGGGTPDPDSGDDESARPKGLPRSSWRHASAAQLLGKLRGLAAARLSQYAEVGYRSGDDLGAGGYNPRFADPETSGGGGTSFSVGSNPDPDTSGPSQGNPHNSGGGGTFTGDPDNPWDAGGYNPHYQPWQTSTKITPPTQASMHITLRRTSPVRTTSLLRVG